MRKLSFEQEGRETPRATERMRQGLLNRMKDAAVVGTALLALGGCAGGMANTPSVSLPQARDAPAREPAAYTMAPPGLRFVSSKQAVSPTADSVEIGGRTLSVVRLDTRLADLDRQTAQYRGQEVIPTTADGIYLNDATVTNVVSFVVSIGRASGMITPMATLTMSYQANPPAERPERSRIDLTGFSTYVRTLTGEEMSRVNIVLERGTFENNGTTTDYTNAYIIPLNASGRAITRQGNGEYIVYAASYYSNSTGGSTSLLVEPGNRDSLYARR